MNYHLNPIEEPRIIIDMSGSFSGVNKITILDTYALEKYDKGEPFYKWVKKIEDEMEVRYNIEYALPIGDKVIIFSSTFHALEDMIIQSLNLLNTSHFFLQIGYMNSSEGIYMSLAENNFGDISFYEEDPEYARPEEIHFITNSFTELLGMINIYEIRIQNTDNSFPFYNGKLVAVWKSSMLFFKKNSNLLPPLYDLIFDNMNRAVSPSQYLDNLDHFPCAIPKIIEITSGITNISEWCFKHINNMQPNLIKLLDHFSKYRHQLEWIGIRNVDNLKLYLTAYEEGYYSGKNHQDTLSNERFSSEDLYLFYCEKYGNPGTKHYLSVIKEKQASEVDGLNIFFKFFDEYLSSNPTLKNSDSIQNDY